MINVFDKLIGMNYDDSGTESTGGSGKESKEESKEELKEESKELSEIEKVEKNNELKKAKISGEVITKVSKDLVHSNKKFSKRQKNLTIAKNILGGIATVSGGILAVAGSVLAISAAYTIFGGVIGTAVLLGVTAVASAAGYKKLNNMKYSERDRYDKGLEEMVCENSGISNVVKAQRMFRPPTDLEGVSREKENIMWK